MLSDSLQQAIDTLFTDITSMSETKNLALHMGEVGIITRISTGVAIVSGLPNVGSQELIAFPDGIYGIAFNVDADEIGVVLLGNYAHLQTGDEVMRTGRIVDVPVGDALIGRVINPLGVVLDGKEQLKAQKRLPIERPAPAIMDRAAVNVPLQTGIMAIDALIPIGRGQRELILGDRQTGKTAIAIDTILNQKGKDTYCIYCAIGQRASSVAKIIARLHEYDAMEYTTVVVSEGNDPPGLTYIAPYAATSIAEHFMEQGHDVLIVYDDLTHHARAYREISLLLNRPPGREAFPGDIFYIHSRLLERATHLGPEQGGGSLTALPIIETEAQDISAYIPTNLISITDGQIYLSPILFKLGILPAVDIGQSVSRVGSKAQFSAYRAVTGNLKLAYSQFLELENFARFGTKLDANTQKTINHGKRIRQCLIQGESEALSVNEQITILLTLGSGLLDDIALGDMPKAMKALLDGAAMLPKEIVQSLTSNEKLSDTDQKTILEIMHKILLPFKKTQDADFKNMSQKLAHLKRRIASAQQLESVVRTMKAQAASSIMQYQSAVTSLIDYAHTIDLGLVACLRQTDLTQLDSEEALQNITAIIFGSDQGFVGQFNAQLADYVHIELNKMSGKKTVLVIGERIYEYLYDIGLTIEKTFEVPNFIHAVTPIIGQILAEISGGLNDNKSLVIFYNLSSPNKTYSPTHQYLLPLDAVWQNSLIENKWPTDKIPEIINDKTQETLRILIREHLFISLFRACAELLTSENTSRLIAMQRAEKNIAEILKALQKRSRNLRQSTIDEELFDVISGYKFDV